MIGLPKLSLGIDDQNPPFEDASFDIVFLQHVARNIEDRPALYAEARGILAPGELLSSSV
jgi:ubiquinone/menaquinone biosynthesis C-methylase UbiE